MDLTSNFPYWTVVDGLPYTYPPLTSDLKADAVVIGGGISGALLAERLTSRGVDTVLLERRDIGHGSTSASTALLQYEIDTPLARLRTLVAPAAAERAYLLGAESIARLQRLAGTTCGFSIRPSIQFASTQREAARLEPEVKLRRAIGLPASFLTTSDLRGMGIRAKAAIHSTVAAEVDPYQLTHRLLQRSLRRGLRVFDQTAAAGYTHTSRTVLVHTNRRHKIRCRAVFFATGYETDDILPRGIVNLQTTYALVTEPVEPGCLWKDRALLWGCSQPYSYARTTPDHRVLFGGGDEAVREAAAREKRIPAKVKELERGMRRLWPGGRTETAFGWAGTFGSTKDGLAYIGSHPAFPNAYFALGFGGNGITFGEIAARVVTDLFLGRRNEDARIFGFDR
ncbi:MAG TPA: FAD-binding oxidoreductase [Bryobacteraceae bacterium]|nr:FAD-binding oxidoreductase [Bryobacteraceae bacterium]